MSIENISEMNEQAILNPRMLKRWTVVMSGSLLFFYSFMQLNILNSIGGHLMEDFHITSTQLGYLSSMYFYANFIFVFPAGLLLDRFSTRKLILLAMGFAVVSMFGFALSNNVLTAGIFRFVSGLGGAFCFVSCVRLASRWFPPEKMALVIGCLVTMCMFGGMMAQTPMVLLTEAFTWRTAMMIMGFLGIFCTVVIWALVKDKPADYEEIAPDSEAESLGFWESIRMVLSNRYNWLGGIYTALTNLPVFLLGALWGSLFLVQALGLNASQASYVISMLFLGTIIGAPLIGWFSDYLGRRCLPMIIGSLIALCVMLVIIYVPHLSLISLMLLFFALGGITGTQSLSYPVVTELNSPLVTASANSIISTLLMASGFLFQPMFGWLMNLHWNHEMIGNTPVYSAHDFHTAMLIMPIAFLVSKIVAFFIKETYCKMQYNNS